MYGPLRYCSFIFNKFHELFSLFNVNVDLLVSIQSQMTVTKSSFWIRQRCSIPLSYLPALQQYLGAAAMIAVIKFAAYVNQIGQPIILG